MKSIKEKELLVNFSKAFGQDIDPALLEEVAAFKTIKDSVQVSVKKNVLNDLAKALSNDDSKPKVVRIEYPLPPSLDEVLNILNETKEEKQDELVQTQTLEENVTEEILPSTPFAEPTLAERSAKFISEAPKDSFQQPDPLVVPDNMDAIRGKLKFLEQWISKVSMAGFGGGAGSVAKLDHETKLITTNTYSVTTKDFYVGINYAGSVTITLPTIVNDGKMYIIKDESGHCSINPITVLGTVDNDTGGFILAQDNGGVQLIYRNGWRIV